LAEGLIIAFNNLFLTNFVRVTAWFGRHLGKGLVVSGIYLLLWSTVKDRSNMHSLEVWLEEFCPKREAVYWNPCGGLHCIMTQKKSCVHP
jgi:hypothetical protein